VLHEARQLHPPHAHPLHPRRRPQGRHRRPRRALHQGQEGRRMQGRQGAARGEVQDRQEQVVLHQAPLLSCCYRRSDMVISFQSSSFSF
jgi:hypothetical protein